MDGAANTNCGEFDCVLCRDSDVPFRDSMSKMRCHIAVFHCGGTYSTLRCGHCDMKFYDLDHFGEHTRGSTLCLPMQMFQEFLSDMQDYAFSSLVGQVARAVQAPSVTPDAPSIRNEILTINVDEEEDEKIQIVNISDDGDNDDIAVIYSSFESRTELRVRDTIVRPKKSTATQTPAPLTDKEQAKVDKIRRRRLFPLITKVPTPSSSSGDTDDE